MMKYYKVLKDTPTVAAGAILSAWETDGMPINKSALGYGNMEYRAIDDVWDKIPNGGAGGWHGYVVEHENNADFFERVYRDEKDGLFYTKEQMKAKYADSFKA